MGEAVKGRREKVLLATKVRMPMGEGPNDAGLSREHILRACDDSLRRLGVDYIDLYQVHGWDGQTPLETLEALDTLVRKGQVRYIGCSNEESSNVVDCRLLIDHAATLVADSSGRSISAPFSNLAPARTSATRCAPLR